MNGDWGRDGREPWGDAAKCGKSCGLHGMSQHGLRSLRDVTVFLPQGPRPEVLSCLCQLANQVSQEFKGVQKWVPHDIGMRGSLVELEIGHGR